MICGPSLDGKFDNKGDLVAHLMREMDLAAGDAIMIGDRREDIVAGRQNGCRTLGVLYGYGSRSELVEAGADELVESPLDLLKLIDYRVPHIRHE